MKHSLFIAFFLCLGSFASAQQLTSPDGNLSLEFMEQADGVPAYRLDRSEEHTSELQSQR